MPASLKKLGRLPGWLWHWFVRYWRRGWWQKAVTVVVAAVLLCVGTMYGIARWYIYSERNVPLTLGVSFIPDYASYLGVDPEQTLTAILGDLHVKQLRLVSYWSDIEKAPGQYDFSQLDWEFALANHYGAQVSLAIGLRQPRWPECHAPSWINTAQPTSQWLPQLETFMSKVINRYKTNPALASYQLENEYFLQAFGTCQDYSRSRLVSEFKLVKRLDSKHPVIISRSNNAMGWPVGAPVPDEYGVSIYRRVWTPPLGRYIEYPFPAWYYAFLAGMEKIWDGKDTIVHELQAEPWPPHGQPIPQTSLAEQSKSFNADRLKNTIQFGEATGMKTIDLWGAEYWYYRMVKLHDPSVWNVAKVEIAQANRAGQ